MVNKQFWNLWSSYALSYFGKVNLGIIIPALILAFPDWNLFNVGFAASGFFGAYAIGQFLHGQISERFNPYVYLSIGLVLSGFTNLLMGFIGGFFIMLVVLESFDGFFQAMGWSSVVRANSHLHTTEQERSKSSTIMGTSYQIGTSITFIVAAFSVANWGWQAGFWVASLFLVFRGVNLYLSRPKLEFKPSQPMKKQVQLTLTFPILMSGISLLFLNMVRYGVLTWFFAYLVTEGHLVTTEFFGFDALKVALIPVAGVLGTLIYNKFPWDKDLTSIVFLTLMGIIWFVFPFTDGLTAVILLLASSAFLYGPHVFLVSTCPTRFKNECVVASSTGFIDGMGYVGTFMIGLIVPFLVIETAGGWDNVFLFWAAISFLSVITVSITYFKHFRITGNNK